MHDGVSDWPHQACDDVDPPAVALEGSLEYERLRHGCCGVCVCRCVGVQLRARLSSSLSSVPLLLLLPPLPLAPSPLSEAIEN